MWGAIGHFTVVYLATWPCIGSDARGDLVTRDALRGHTVSKNGSISFLFFFYTECPQGLTCLGFGRVSFFFFFIVVTNVHINLCTILCPPLVRIYCSDCLQQKRPNQNIFFRYISRERGPTHHFLCDVKSLFDLFIKP